MTKKPSRAKGLEEQLAATSKALEESQAKERAASELLLASQEREAEHIRELEALRAQADEARAAAEAQAAAAAVAATAATPELIEKPRGDFSLATILQQHNILSDEQLAIHQYLSGFMGMLDEKKLFSHQDPAQVAAVRAAVSREYPVLSKFRDQWPVTNMIQDRLRNRRIQLQKLGLIEKTHRNYKTTAEQRQEQSKRANVISVEKRRARNAQTNAVRQQEQAERNGEHEGIGANAPTA